MDNQILTSENHDLWYLGIDFGTKGLSATLCNAREGKTYQISWLNLQEGNSGQFSPILPSAVYYNLSPTTDNPDSNLAPKSGFTVGNRALELAKEQPGLFVEGIKPYLNLTIPYYAQDQRQWQPQFEDERQSALSLYFLHQSLQALCATLTPNSAYQCQIWAEGLDPGFLGAILGQLEGIIVNSPGNFGDTYRFNLREAILRANLVSEAGQIWFVEDAIALILGYYGQLREQTGLTLIIHGGVSTTELALVELPPNLADLSYQDVNHHSWSYGSNALEQDLLTQLIYPQWLPQLDTNLANLGLIMPEVGETATSSRLLARWRLQKSAIGRSLLEAAKLSLLILQKRPSFSSQLGKQQWGIEREQLEARVINPVIEQLNHQLNLLLTKTGKSQQQISQILVTGEMIPLLARSLPNWLKSKLPDAQLIFPDSTTQKQQMSDGLAKICLLPQLIDQYYHQYSDYFLLSELLQIAPSHPITFKEILQLMQQRGINTKVCAARIENLLKNKLPQGLIPEQSDYRLLTAQSLQNPYYQTLANTPLFNQIQDSYYQLSEDIAKLLTEYLRVIVAGTIQNWQEPLSSKII